MIVIINSHTVIWLKIAIFNSMGSVWKFVIMTAFTHVIVMWFHVSSYRRPNTARRCGRSCPTVGSSVTTVATTRRWRPCSSPFCSACSWPSCRSSSTGWYSCWTRRHDDAITPGSSSFTASSPGYAYCPSTWSSVSWPRWRYRQLAVQTSSRHNLRSLTHWRRHCRASNNLMFFSSLKGSNTLESFLSKVAFESSFRKKSLRVCHENFRNFSSFERNFHD